MTFQEGFWPFDPPPLGAPLILVHVYRSRHRPKEKRDENVYTRMCVWVNVVQLTVAVNGLEVVRSFPNGRYASPRVTVSVRRVFLHVYVIRCFSVEKKRKNEIAVSVKWFSDTERQRVQKPDGISQPVSQLAAVTRRPGWERAHRSENKFVFYLFKKVCNQYETFSMYNKRDVLMG